MSTRRSALIVGVGDEEGLGAGLAHRIAREGYRVCVAGRAMDKLVQVARGISDAGGDVIAVVADATSEPDVAGLFECADDGALDVVVFNAGESVRQEASFGSSDVFEHAWRTAALGGFLVGQEAARRLALRRAGTVIFTGAIVDPKATAQLAALAAAKAALRSVAQSLAREMRPFGVHVAHVIVDGGFDGDLPPRLGQFGDDGFVNIDAIAGVCVSLHREHRSAWTHELDLRPVRPLFRSLRPGAFNSIVGVEHGLAE